MNTERNYSSDTKATDTTKYLTFELDSEEFGVRIKTVREIVRMIPITRIPRMPSHVLGVVNLRGQVIPIIDLRTRFGLPVKEAVDETRIIVVDVMLGEELTNAGFVVDRVKEVIAISADVIEKAPAATKSNQTSFLVGLAKVGDSVTAILDVDSVLSDRAIAETATSQAA